MKHRFFTAQEMLDFYQRLPEKKNIISDIKINTKSKVLIMTHDDTYDEEMHDYALEHGGDCTFFCLASKARPVNNDADIQFHWNKGSHFTLKDQIRKFQDRSGVSPWANRNHRLYWRERHLDLACLSMHGFKHDSSIIGQGSYLPVIQQRILPILETELTITDWPVIDVTKTATCTYSISSHPKTLFELGKTPIMALFHPYLKHQSKWKTMYTFAENYGYKVMSVKKYHEFLYSQKKLQNHLPR